MLDKIEGILMSWQTRGLTKIGKVQVINSLINSLFIYKFQCLPNPKEDFFIQYKKRIRDFIWDNKKATISYNKLILSKDKGGLQLRDLKMVNTSLKIANFRKLFLPIKPFWVQYLRSIIPLSDDHLKIINMQEKDMAHNLGKSIFADMCSAWSKINFWTPNTVVEIYNQLLWFNSHIKIKGKWFFEADMYALGINKVIDLFDLDTGRFYTFDEFKTMFPFSKTNFIDYYRIIKAIPAEWKNILLRNEPSLQSQSRTQWLDKFLKPKVKPARMAYFKLQENLPNKIESLLLIWNTDLKIKMQTENLESHFKRIDRITLQTKLRFFQYRLLNKALPTNVLISKWVPENDGKCYFCKSKPETIIHLFIDCIYVQKLWKALCKWLKYFHDVKVVLTSSNKMFCDVSTRSSRLINHLILLTKFYIYKTKAQESKLCFVNLLSEINESKKIELVIAKRNDKLYPFARKWDDFSIFT